jgi:cytochrome c-type biogenesis protein CcmE
MENKVVFVDGLNVFQPNENAPDWIKADMVINPTQLVKWLEQNDQHLREGKRGLELRLQIKKSAQGKLYASVDTFKPKKEVTLNGDMANQFNESQSITANGEEEDLPF